MGDSIAAWAGGETRFRTPLRKCCLLPSRTALQHSSVGPLAVIASSYLRSPTSTPDLGPIGKRFPPGDRPYTQLGIGVVRDQRKVSAQFDNAGQLAVIIASSADRFSGGFVNGEHARHSTGTPCNGHPTVARAALYSNVSAHCRYALKPFARRSLDITGRPLRRARANGFMLLAKLRGGPSSQAPRSPTMGSRSDMSGTAKAVLDREHNRSGWRQS